MNRFLVMTTVFTLANCTSLLGMGESEQDHAWPESTPEQEGFDPVAIDTLLQDMQQGKYGKLDHFLLIRHGRIVVDRHFEHDYATISAEFEPQDHQYDYHHPNWHPYYQGTSLHTLQSVTKSITSIAVGIAMDQGKIPGGVKTPAMSFFEGYEFSDDDPRRAAMTLEDLLTMRSGIAWNEMTSYADPKNSCTQLEQSEEWIQFILNQPMREAPGTVFDYNSGASVLIGKIVRVATGQRIDAFLDQHLFQPLGIKEFYWKETPGRRDRHRGRPLPRASRSRAHRPVVSPEGKLEWAAIGFRRVGGVVDGSRRA